jgi:hypothetical protein
MTWTTVGSAGRAEDSDDLEIRIAGPVRRCYRVLATDVPYVLLGYPAVLYAGDPAEADPVGDVESSASGRMLLGQSRAGLGFRVTVPSSGPLPVDTAEWLVVRDHLRAHYYRDDGPVEVLGGAA